jgi:hypothetical protein
VRTTFGICISLYGAPRRYGAGCFLVQSLALVPATDVLERLSLGEPGQDGGALPLDEGDDRVRFYPLRMAGRRRRTPPAA